MWGYRYRMPIVILCPKCKTRLTLGDDRAGTTLECPRCDGPLSIPVALLPPPASPPPASSPRPIPARPIPAPDPRDRMKPRPRRSRERDENPSHASSAAALILALILGVIIGGAAGAGLGFVGGAVIAESTVRYRGGGEYYDANGRTVNPAGTGMAGVCCMTPFGSLIGAAVGCMYIMTSSKRRGRN